MPRSKTGSTRRKKHKKVLKQAKGFRLSASTRVKTAKEAVLHADQYAYIGRKLRKRDMRKLWIQRINAGLTQVDGPKYSVFINLLKQNDIKINRKMLSELVVNDIDTFEAIVKKVYGN